MQDPAPLKDPAQPPSDQDGQDGDPEAARAETAEFRTVPAEEPENAGDTDTGAGEDDADAEEPEPEPAPESGRTDDDEGEKPDFSSVLFNPAGQWTISAPPPDEEPAEEAQADDEPQADDPSDKPSDEPSEEAPTDEAPSVEAAADETPADEAPSDDAPPAETSGAAASVTVPEIDPKVVRKGAQETVPEIDMASVRPKPAPPEEDPEPVASGPETAPQPIWDEPEAEPEPAQNEAEPEPAGPFLDETPDEAPDEAGAHQWQGHWEQPFEQPVLEKRPEEQQEERPEEEQPEEPPEERPSAPSPVQALEGWPTRQPPYATPPAPAPQEVHPPQSFAPPPAPPAPSAHPPQPPPQVRPEPQPQQYAPAHRQQYPEAPPPVYPSPSPYGPAQEEYPAQEQYPQEYGEARDFNAAYEAAAGEVKGRKKRRRGLLTLIVVLVLLAGAATGQLVRPVPEPTMQLTLPASSHTFPGAAPALPLPAQGQSALHVDGLGAMGSSGGTVPTPTASVAKMMTAYVFLRDHPLAAGQPGPTYTVSPQAAAQIPGRKQRGESLLGVTSGMRLTERKALEALMIISANDVAHELARWDAGQPRAFVQKMNDAARSLGMTSTRYTDPSGYDSRTVSTAADQVKLLRAAMSMPAFVEVVSKRAYVPTNGGPPRPGGNILIGQYGVIGGKTGYTDAAGGNYVFAARKQVGGVDTMFLGAVMGQQSPSAMGALQVAKNLLAVAENALTSVTLANAGARVGRVRDGLGDVTPLRAGAPITVVGWPGLTVQVKVDGEPPRAAGQGARVGNVRAGAANVPLELDRSLSEPSLLKRLIRLG
ncbi:hypothetical protein GCM10010191_39060 [Actinomadura vinacea]|uniref:Peptidase S11 D-alanyl-D-alanine carboxypeptidase A N-terminal domain-containing protein n=1 Tax=Actinomadura vinacea TaxID=115336 RepID=A0ABN3J761_9ACTN